MTHRNLAPEEILPGQLVLRTEGACDLDQQQLLDVWARQRQRFVEVLRGFGPDDWDAPATSKVARWLASHVQRPGTASTLAMFLVASAPPTRAGEPALGSVVGSFARVRGRSLTAARRASMHVADGGGRR